jgi:hypothetical protein
MGKRNFKSDLKNAQAAEQELAKIFTDAGHKVSDTSLLGKFSGYDLIIKYEHDNGQISSLLIEVKHDLKALETGNIALEIFKKISGIPYDSGLSATKAHFYFYKIGDIFYFIHVNHLLEYLEAQEQLKIVMGGDFNSSVIILLKVEEFKIISHEFTIEKFKFIYE